MRGLESVLCSRGAHADDFLSAEVRADEGEAADPRRQRASGLKEVLAGLHIALEGETNAQHKHEIQQHDEPINERQLQSCSLRRNHSRSVPVGFISMSPLHDGRVDDAFSFRDTTTLVLLWNT